MSASVEGTQKEDFEWLMNINFWGVVNGTRAFLPLLKQAPWGHVVNVSSLFGLLSLPNQSAYNASKYAVRGYTESLRTEMLMEKSRVQVSCVHPGGIKTNIANEARYSGQVGSNVNTEKMKALFNDSLARTTAEQAANIIVTGINKNKARILVGIDAKLLDLLQRLLPSLYQKVMAKFSP
jgi:short-subunit dehydrogenase